MRILGRLNAVCVAGILGAGLANWPVGHATGAPTCEVGAPCVDLHLPDGDTAVITGARIGALSTGTGECVQYPERIVAGGPQVDGPCVLRLVSVHDLLADLLPQLSPPVDPNTIETMKLIRPFNGSASFLTGHDLDDPSDFSDPRLLPAFYLTGDNGSLIQYVRPLRASTTDVNASDDEIQSPTDGSALDLSLYTGPLLNARATRSKSTITAGQSVTFTGTAPGARSFRWDFGDGTTGRGARISHAFAQSGTFQILLSVSGPGDATGAAGPISVTVEPASGSRSPRPSPGRSPPSTSRPSSRPAAGGAGSNSGPADAGGRVPGEPSRTAGQSSSAVPSPMPSARRTRPAQATPGAVVVTGRVLGARPAVEPASDPAAASASTTGEPAEGWSAGHALAGGGAGVAIILLLGTGAASEWRWRASPGRRSRHQ